MIRSLNITEDALPGICDFDEQALASLFGLYRERLRQLVSARLDRRLAARIDADDVLQEVYLDASSRIHHYNHTHPESFYCWIKLVLTQTMTDIFRRHLDTKKRDANREISLNSPTSSESSTTHEAMQLRGREPSPSQSLMREEAMWNVKVAIHSMKRVDREIIELRHFQELDNKDVACVLGITQKSASIRYSRAMSRLKNLLCESENQPDQPDAEVVRLWNHFKDTYPQLGYRRATFAYFAQWLHDVAPHLAETPTREIRRRLHAYRQRLQRSLRDT